MDVAPNQAASVVMQPCCFARIMRLLSPWTPQVARPPMVHRAMSILTSKSVLCWAAKTMSTRSGRPDRRRRSRPGLPSCHLPVCFRKLNSQSLGFNDHLTGVLGSFPDARLPEGVKSPMNWALVRSTPKTGHRGVRAERQQWANDFTAARIHCPSRPA
jgi:hypothetical protein